MTNVIAFLAEDPTPQRPTGLHKALQWEAVLARMKRLETSAPLSRFAFDQSNRMHLPRAGLGPWVCHILHINDHTFIVATPAAETPFGASIWFDPRLTYRQAARLTLQMVSPGPTPVFITATGRKVTPA